MFDDDEPIDATGSPPPAKKAKTSSYFGAAKAGSSAGPSRKPSTSRDSSNAPAHLQSYRLPRLDPVSRSQAGSAFDAFNYPVPSQPRASQARTAAQQAKHEEWHRKVVGGTLIPRRRSLALDEAAALEARRQMGVEDEGEEIVTPPVDEGGDSEEERQKTADKLGESLAAKYGAKDVKDKGKGKATARKKKVEEVGPSGQTYTPLEKQYLEHKAQNPDVLLMMEGESCQPVRRHKADGPSRIQVQVGDNLYTRVCILISRFHGEDAKVSRLADTFRHILMSDCFTRTGNRSVSWRVSHADHTDSQFPSTKFLYCIHPHAPSPHPRQEAHLAWTQSRGRHPNRNSCIEEDWRKS